MSSYGALAEFYDRLTGDVKYNQFADYYEAEFKRCGGGFKMLLDLCCGTGTLTQMMTDRGYDMIAVDGSEEMLMEARDKIMLSLPAGKQTPLFLCQKADELDLYGTVDAAYCSLDGINYLSKSELKRTLSRLKFFIKPGGLFIFDVRTKNFYEQTDGRILVDEDEDMLCLWRADWYPEKSQMIYGMDLFIQDEDCVNAWSREKEEHTEYFHSIEYLEKILKGSSFGHLKICDKLLENDPERIFITAERI